MKTTQLIVEPDDGEQPVVEFLRSAKREVLMKQFTFTHRGLLDEVLGLQRRGVKVKVMLNGAKATGERLNDAFFEIMTKAGVETQWSNPAFLVTHEKSIVVDRSRAMAATFNFMEKYFTQTRDYGVVIVDPLQVEQIAECFEADWNRVKFHPVANSGLAWSTENSRYLYCEFLDTAAKSIDVQHPKFAEPVVVQRLIAAIQRGVRVRVLCGGKHGLHQPDLMESFAMWQLVRWSGGKVHKQKNLRSHSKAIIVDGERALFGSVNLDQPAFDHRRELGVFLRDAPVIKRMMDVFESDWEKSRGYEPPYPLHKPSEEEFAEFEHDDELMHD